MAPVRHQNPEPDTGQHACLLYGACMAPYCHHASFSRTRGNGRVRQAENPLAHTQGPPVHPQGYSTGHTSSGPGGCRKGATGPRKRLGKAGPAEAAYRCRRQEKPRPGKETHGSGPARPPNGPRAGGWSPGGLAHRLHEQGVHGGARGGRSRPARPRRKATAAGHSRKGTEGPPPERRRADTGNGRGACSGNLSWRHGGPGTPLGRGRNPENSC